MILLFLLLALLWHARSRPKAAPHMGRRIAPAAVRGKSRRKAAWVRREIIRLKALTGQSCYKLADTFNRMYAAERQVTVGKTWVAEVVRNHRYEIADLRRHYQRRVPKPQARNACWGLDFTGKGDASNAVHAIIGIIDHGSRLALALRPLPDRTAVTTLKVVLQAIETFGMPKIIKTDNDVVFTSRL